MRWGVVRFPGSLDDRDTVFAIESAWGDSVRSLWHKDHQLPDLDCVVLPGGFSYGDYLRPGALARFSPLMDCVVEFARSGGLVMGICNGFQILCEAGLLPGALVRNRDLRFVCAPVWLRVENAATPFTGACAAGEKLRIPIKHGEGCFVAADSTLKALEEGGQVILRYCAADGSVCEAANPNGSLHNIAGIVNRAGNVMGLMPHPEHACDALLGGADGLRIFAGIRAGIEAAAASAAASDLPA